MPFANVLFFEGENDLYPVGHLVDIKIVRLPRVTADLARVLTLPLKLWDMLGRELLAGVAAQRTALVDVKLLVGQRVIVGAGGLGSLAHALVGVVAHLSKVPVDLALEPLEEILERGSVTLELRAVLGGAELVVHL